MAPPESDTPAPPVTESVLARRGASLVLAIAGTLLWVGAGALFLSAVGSIAGSEGKVSLAVAALGLGAVCHLLVVVASVKRARALRRVPIAALLYTPLILAGVAYGVYAAGAETRALRETPGEFHIEYLSGDSQIGLRDGSGTWWVRVTACPGHESDANVDVQPGNGFADVTYGWAGEALPEMRLHVAERRVECFGPDGPPPLPYTMHLTFGGPAGRLDEARTSIDLHGDTLVSRLADGRTARAVPSDADWRTFRAALDSSDVAHWGRFVYDWDGSAAGMQWTAAIRAPNLDVTGGSRDAYPGTEGTPADAPTPEFARYVRAVEALVGQPIR